VEPGGDGAAGDVELRCGGGVVVLDVGEVGFQELEVDGVRRVEVDGRVVVVEHCVLLGC